MNKQLGHEEVNFDKKDFPVSLLLDNITGEANLGSIFRLADAFGVDKLIFTGTKPNLESNRLKRTSRNTHKTVNFDFAEEASGILNEYKNEGFQVIGLEITSDSIPLHELSVETSEKIILVAGNERHGISDEVLNLCDKVCHIEMFGENSSMNVAQSVGIALYEITRFLHKFHKK